MGEVWPWRMETRNNSGTFEKEKTWHNLLGKGT